MLELKNNKHNTYYRCTYLYIVNAVFFKQLLTSYLKRDLAKKNNNNNVTTLICIAISMRAKVLHDPLVQYSRGLDQAQIYYGNMDYLHNYFRVLLITAQEFTVSIQRTYIQTVSHENADYYYILGLAFLKKN